MNDILEALSAQEELDELEGTSEEIPLEGNVITKQSDPEIDSLYKKYKKGKLILQPTFQRGFVWDRVKSSRLIESALLDIPIPMIYLAEEEDGKEVVIDGQQRLTAFFSFIDKVFPNNSKNNHFKLGGLTKYKSLIGLDFTQLSEAYQDKIMCYQVRTITIKKESSGDLKFEIFERLNTASVGLNDQELRNCIHRGEYNQLLINLAKNNDFLSLLGLDKPHHRMLDVELVLRFAAFYHNSYLNYKGSMKRFLNKEMDKYKNTISETEATELEKAFKQAISLMKSIFDDKAFKKYYIGTSKKRDGHWEKKSLNKALFDILMYTFSKTEKRIIFGKIDIIREGLIDLMCTDKEFINSISYFTNNPSSVKTRFHKWTTVFNSIIEQAQIKSSKRTFSYQLKEELYTSSPICSICNQKIANIDDAHIDHIIQYWKGGETIPENARLTHRFCNQSRSLND